MSMHRLTSRIALPSAVFLVLAQASIALAQQTSATGGGLAPGPDGLEIFGTIRGAYDTRLTANLAGSDSPVQSVGGLFPTADVTASYSRRRPAGAFSLWAGSGAQYYSQLEQPLAYDNRVGASATFRANARTSIETNYSSSYASYYTLSGLTAGTDTLPQGVPTSVDTTVPAFQQRIASLQGWRHSGRLGVVRQFSARTVLGAYGGVDASSYASLGTFSVSGGAELGRQVSARQRLFVRYALLRGVFSDQAVGTTHTPEAGFDYNARSYSLQLTGGGAVTSYPEFVQTTVIGGARVLKPIGRAWTGSFGYQRGVQFSYVLGRFITSDGADANFSRFFRQRIEWNLSGRYANGRSNLANQQRVRSLGAGSSVTFPMNRSLGMVVDYSHFFYSLDATLASFLGLPTEVQRDVVMVGLAWRFTPRP